MSISPNPNDAASAAAAEWFARRRAGRWSEPDAVAFAAWLKTDSSHPVAWASCERLWGHVGTVRDDPRILAIRERALQSAARRKSVRRAWSVGAALAASLLLGVSVWLSMQHSTTPALAGAATSEGASSTPLLVREASTAVGERSIVMLADGSKLTLNTASAVRADYSGRERRVTLIRGEAFFEVARDAARPFVVFAGDRQVVALGTSFGVRLQDHRVKVTLVEGKVRVARISEPSAVSTTLMQAVPAVLLEAGSMLITGEDDADQVEHLDTVRATSWRNGKLVFDGERLADVVAEMNRYSREQLEIADTALEERKVSGVFEPAGGPGFARALQAYGIARVSRQSQTTIVLESPR